MKRMALGKGLEALIPGSAAGKEGEAADSKFVITEIPIDSIIPNRYQPRENFDKDRQAELIESIKESGLIQPIVVRKVDGKNEILVGERRFRAVQKLNWKTIPAIIHESVSNETALQMAIIENIQRENLNPIEEANAYYRLVTECNLSQSDVAGKVGKDRASVANSIRLLSLPDEIKTMLTGGRLTAGHARTLLGTQSDDEKIALAKKAAASGMSVRELENIVYANKPRRKRKAPKERSPQFVSLEDALKRKLATKVTISEKAKGGKIIIEYYSDDELNRLLEILGVLESY
jgi:ParB family chromosome partitioning protein